MQDDITTTSSGESEQVAASTPAEATTSAPVQAETPQTSEATQGSDSFFDPKSVPEELMPAYKQMQAAFTKKTQEVAASRKEAEALKTKADAYARYEQYIPVIEEMLTQKPTGATTPEMVQLEAQLRNAGYSDEAIEMMRIGAGFLLNQFNQNLTARDRQAQVESQIQQAQAIDPRLEDESLVYTMPDGSQTTFGDIVSKLVIANPEWTNDPVGATREAIKTVDALITNAKTAGKAELSASASSKANRFPPTASSPQQAASTGEGISSIQDAAAQAQRELGIELR